MPIPSSCLLNFPSFLCASHPHFLGKVGNGAFMGFYPHVCEGIFSLLKGWQKGGRSRGLGHGTAS